MNAESSAPSESVRHNASEHRYEIQSSQGLAVADYLDQGEVRVMTHTFVPPELRGRGLAEKLVRRALDDARAERRTVVPACAYVATFIQRHPAYADLVAK